MKNSEIISTFLTLLRNAESSCVSAGDSQHIEDMKTQDILGDILISVIMWVVCYMIIRL